MFELSGPIVFPVQHATFQLDVEPCSLKGSRMLQSHIDEMALRRIAR